MTKTISQADPKVSATFHTIDKTRATFSSAVLTLFVVGFFTLASKNHPWINSDADVAERFQNINSFFANAYIAAPVLLIFFAVFLFGLYRYAAAKQISAAKNIPEYQILAGAFAMIICSALIFTRPEAILYPAIHSITRIF